jgi:hypothetical protein
VSIKKCSETRMTDSEELEWVERRL